MNNNDFLYVATVVEAPKVSDPSMPQLEKVFASVIIRKSDVIEESLISRKKLFIEYFGYTEEDWNTAVARSKHFGNEIIDDEVQFVRFNYRGQEQVGWLEKK